MNSKKKENGPKYQYGMSGTDGGYTGTGTTQGTAEDLKADGEKKPWTSTTLKVILIIAIILVEAFRSSYRWGWEVLERSLH